MSTLAAPSLDRLPTDDRAVLDRLARVSSLRGAKNLAERLVDLDRWVRADLAEFSRELDAIPRGARVVHRAAHHLLDLRGKHLRPLCVALASRFGEGFEVRIARAPDSTPVERQAASQGISVARIETERQKRIEREALEDPAVKAAVEILGGKVERIQRLDE